MGNFCLHLINAAFFLILNIYMQKSGYLDYEIGSFISYRFGAVVLFAIPFGLYIKNKPLRPFFMAASVLVPLISLFSLEAVEQHWNGLLALSFVCWGISFSNVFICTLPYIIRNVPKETHTEALSLNAATWSSATIIAGFLIFFLKSILPDLFTDKFLLQCFSLVGLLGVYFMFRMTKQENIPLLEATGQKAEYFDYDWSLIAKTTTPVFMIALGAGLTIPFMNLFFFNLFGMDSDTFSLLGSFTSILVVACALLIPKIKNRFGYEAITKTQSLSVMCLILLGATDFMTGYIFALPLAIICYVARQPLMNLANPMTSEMAMYYVGKKNQEIVSAINSSIWSGSWFFSSQIFRYLREMDLRYGYIIFITAGFYILGVICYHFLILDFRKKEKKGLIEMLQ